MSEKFRLDHKIGFQNTFYTKCINVIIASIGPSIILRSIYAVYEVHPPINKENVNINLSLKFFTAVKMTLNIETSNEAIWE